MKVFEKLMPFETFICFMLDFNWKLDIYRAFCNLINLYRFNWYIILFRCLSLKPYLKFQQFFLILLNILKLIFVFRTFYSLLIHDRPKIILKISQDVKCFLRLFISFFIKYNLCNTFLFPIQLEKLRKYQKWNWRLLIRFGFLY